MNRCLNLERYKLISQFASTIFCAVKPGSLHKIMRCMILWDSKCELLKDSYKVWQHTETFDAGKLVQSVIFIYYFDAFFRL